jgi:hypothetical protein
MSEMFGHPFRIAALLLGFVLVALAGAMETTRSGNDAVVSDGWVIAALEAMDLERQAMVGGSDPIADEAASRQLEARLDTAGQQLEASLRLAGPLSDEMARVAYSLHRYLAHTEQLYRTASIRQIGTPLPNRSDGGYMQQQVEKQAQYRADVHAALVQAGQDSLALRVDPPPGVQAKLGPLQEAHMDLAMQLRR